MDKVIRTKENFYINTGLFSGTVIELFIKIKNKEIDIREISLELIIDSFIKFIEFIKEKKIDEVSEFISIISYLVYIKSVYLIPLKNEKKEEDLSIEEMEFLKNEVINTIFEYKKFKELLKILELKYTNSFEIVFYKDKNSLIKERSEDWEEISIMELFNKFSKILNSKDEKKEIILFNEEINIKNDIENIRKLLLEKKTFNLWELFNDSKKNFKLRFISVFLALLELAKLKEIIIYQSKRFDSIIITKK